MPHTTDTTLITAAGTADSADRYGCPGVHELDDRTEKFVVTRDVDEEVRRRLRRFIKPGESVGAVPPWVPCGLMDLPTVGRFIDDHVLADVDPTAPLDDQLREVCRVEGLPLYDVESDPSWKLWQDGAYDLDWRAKQDWLDELADHVDRGISHKRVRLFGDPDLLPAGAGAYQLSEHEVYECNWGYAINTQEHNGTPLEDIRVLRAGEHEFPMDWDGLEGWLVNRKVALPMQYDRRGRFVGAGWLGPRETAPILTDWDQLWDAAEPFTTWWARHGELHRSSRQVA